MSVTSSGSAGFNAVAPHNIICTYFFVGNPEKKYRNDNSGDLLLKIARICFLLSSSTIETERKPTCVLLDSKSGMQKNVPPSLNLKKSSVNYLTLFGNYQAFGIYKFSSVVVGGKGKGLILLLQE